MNPDRDPAPLTEGERRALRELQQHLVRTDPGLVRTLRDVNVSDTSTARLLLLLTVLMAVAVTGGLLVALG